MAFEAVPQPTTYAERLSIADRTREEFDLRCEIVVDDMDDRSRAFFGDQPNSLFLIGPDGVIRLKQPWADPDELESTLETFLESAREQLDGAAAKPGASLRTLTAHGLLATDPEVRSRLLESWDDHVPPDLSDTGRVEADRLRWSLATRDSKLDAETLSETVGDARHALRLTDRQAREPLSEVIETERRIALASMLASLRKRAPRALEQTLAETLRGLARPEGRMVRWIETWSPSETDGRTP